MKNMATILAHLVGMSVAVGAVFVLRYFNCLCEYRFGAGVQNWRLVPYAIPLEVILAPILYLGVVFLCKWVLASVKVCLVLEIGGAVILVLAAFVLFVTGEAPAKCYLEGFQQRVTSLVLVQDVVQWRQQLLALRGNKDSFRKIQGTKYPGFVSVIGGPFKPEVTVTFDEDGKSRFALIRWGGGFQSYGIIVDLNGRYPAKATPFYFKQWTDNIYFFVGG
jgi:hypothetical protein